MAFTRKHYERVADILAIPAQEERNTHTFTGDSQLEPVFDIVCRLADLFEADNERFNRDRFFDRVYNKSSNQEIYSETYGAPETIPGGVQVRYRG